MTRRRDALDRVLEHHREVGAELRLLRKRGVDLADALCVNSQLYSQPHKRARARCYDAYTQYSTFVGLVHREVEVRVHREQERRHLRRRRRLLVAHEAERGLQRQLDGFELLLGARRVALEVAHEERLVHLQRAVEVAGRQLRLQLARHVLHTRRVRVMRGGGRSSGGLGAGSCTRERSAVHGLLRCCVGSGRKCEKEEGKQLCYFRGRRHACCLAGHEQLR